MSQPLDLYIDGAWQASASSERIAVVNPATEETIAYTPAGSAEDVDRAVRAARRAFAHWSALPRAERIAALDRLRQGVERRSEAFATRITAQMGAPLAFSRAAQVGLGLRNLDAAARAMEAFEQEETIGHTLVVHRSVGVVAAITPWNFPLHQITAKIAPALVAGCTVVLKASEITPLDAKLLAECVHEAGFPPGVFNLVAGLGVVVGEALARHPGVDLVSFTGSTPAGLRVAQLAAVGLKKVTLELGGKSANVLLDDADLAQAVPAALGQCFANTGQTCAALTRLLVPAHRLAEIEERAVAACASWVVGDPLDSATRLGPLASAVQQQRVFGHVNGALAEGARLCTGGAQRPAHLARGAYAPPTLLSGVHNRMRIARDEVFGPVLALIPYADEDEAVRIANDSAYGLSGGVWSADAGRAAALARRLETGHVVINGAPLNVLAPFGGCKLSGQGREYGRHGLAEYFHTQSLQGAVAVAA